MKRDRPSNASARNVSAPFEFMSNKGEPWRIVEWDLFRELTGLPPEHIPVWHGWITSGKHQHSERICRMLFGINPATQGLETNADYTVVWTVPQLAEKLSAEIKGTFTESQVLDQVRKFMMPDWHVWLEDHPIDAMVIPTRAEKPATPDLPPDVGDEEHQEALRVCAQFDFRDFALPSRSDQLNRAEARWLKGRLEELQGVFADPNAKSLVRQAVTNEMMIRRIDEEMMRLRVVDKEFWRYQEAKQGMEVIYAKQWDQLREICPEIKAKEAKFNFAGVFSEIVDGIIKYRANADNQMIDGIFTALEIQVLMRSSVQAEGRVQYRPDIAIATNEARKAIFDPKFRSRLDQKTLSVMSAAWHAAAEAFTIASGIKLPDLESKTGEYPPLFVPPPEVSSQQVIEDERELVIPENPVELAP